MIVTLRHRPPLWELHAPFTWVDSIMRVATSYLAGLLTEAAARGYAAGQGWRIAE
jgi:hypothetical protein